MYDQESRRPDDTIWASPAWPRHPGGWADRAGMAPQNGTGAAARVLGIISAGSFGVGGGCLVIFPIGVLATTFIWWPSALLCGVLGVILGAVGLAKVRGGRATNRGSALTGIICGGVPVVMVAAVVVYFVVGVKSAVSR